MTHNFLKDLKYRLTLDLPGPEAQNRMAPLRISANINPGDSGKAGVLILIFPRKGEFTIVLIKRTEYSGPHSGQISFPGGKTEKSDGSQINTALREAFEETGIDRSTITVLGALTPLYIPVSNLEVLPVVGFTHETPEFIIDSKEVEYLICLSLKDLLGDRLKSAKKLSVRGISIQAPGYVINNEFVWGATAMILSEFAEIVSEILNSTQE